MRDDVKELQARIRQAQDVMITNGPIMAVAEGRVHVTDAMREAVRRPGSGVTGDLTAGEHRDASSYDPVLRFHTRT